MDEATESFHHTDRRRIRQYVSKVIRITNDNVSLGYLLAKDAEATIDAASATSFGMP
jgi:hypothetical protein